MWTWSNTGKPPATNRLKSGLNLHQLNGDSIMASAQPKPQYITDDQGNRVSVVLPVDEYQDAEVLAALKADGKL